MNPPNAKSLTVIHRRAKGNLPMNKTRGNTLIVLCLLFRTVCCTSGMILLGALPLRADIATPAVFGTHMVLQQGRRVPVWGTASEGEKVTASFGGQRAETVAKNGRWMVWLEPMKATSTSQSMTISGSNTITFTDVLVGEVWICSGQSNMERKLPQLVSRPPVPPANWEQEAARANYPEIRHLTVPQASSTKPLATFEANWVNCSPETVLTFTAVGYYFGRDLHKTLKVPIGLIHSSYGGSIAESWTREGALRANPELVPIMSEYEEAIRTYPQRLAKYQADEPKLRARYAKALAEAKATGKPRPNPPHAPPDPLKYVNSPSALYNAMIHPLIPYAIRGVIWYQGETNRLHADLYRKLFPNLIADWRSQWGEGDFPFLFVQIAPCKMIGPEIREAQFLTLKKSPNTAMTVITDWGNPNNMHPIHKEPVGARLALAARALAYGQQIEYSGPLFREAKAAAGTITISFDHIGQGLAAKDGPLKGFTIAGPDKVFVPAHAEIVGATVVVSSPQVTRPVAVRYGWANVPDVNLYNSAGLPA